MEGFLLFFRNLWLHCFLYPTEHPRDRQGSVSPVGKAGGGGTESPQQVTPAPSGGGTDSPQQVTPAPSGGGTNSPQQVTPGAGMAQDSPQQVTPSWGRDGTGQPSAGDTWAGMAQDSPQQVTPTWGRDGTGQATFCCDLTEQLCHSPWCPPGSCPSCGAQVTRGQPHLAAPAGWIPLLDLPAASGGAIPVCEDGNWLLDPRAPEGLQLPALGATLTSCSVSPLWQSSSSGRCVLWDVTFPGGLGVRVVFKPAVAQCCASIARPSLRDLLLKTRCVVGVENRSSINLSSSVVWKCVSVVCLTY
ncbi:BRI3-binding protein isoform X2 [Catharus ustulatus]|uniref:BRI3-binding protein isoform X2 n=1 Tax=Catharus ustulatus TaxID=91951 RepID=UPI00140E2E3B|nr:BRI3-binding protein isoform X2 [Catharus ustulatus]